MTDIVEFLFPAPAPRSVAGIVGWWERRRLAYNAMVGAAGMVSLTAVALMMMVLGEGLELSILAPAAVFGVMANVCYLLGPALEIGIHRLWGPKVLPVGPMLYRAGLTFSVGLALFPMLILILVGVVNLVLMMVGAA
jgi:hypothetical protein